MLAERLGLEDGDRDRLRWAALLHDLGNGALLYTANADSNGIDQFEHTVLDSTGACDSAGVTVEIL